MARRLDAFPTPAGQRYPWDEWLNGDVWQLYRGEDYQSRTATLVGNARSQAKRKGGVLKTRLTSENNRESIILQFESGDRARN